MALTSGTKLGRYRILSDLGRGSTCLVYRAADDSLDAEVAVKVLADNLATDFDVRARFIEEAQLLRRRPSPDLLAIHDVGETSTGQPYLVLEMATGGSLAARRPVEVSDDEIRVLVDFLHRSLTHLHRQDVVHRDLKPSNILVTGTAGGSRGHRALADGERYVLSDLGLAKDLGSGSSFTMGAGSVGFSAPEQTRGFTRITPAVDVYGASAVVAWFAAGKSDGRVEPEKRVELIRNAQLQAALRSGLSEDPDERPSLDEWHRSVVEALDGSPARPVPSNPQRFGGWRLTMTAAAALAIGFGTAQLFGNGGIQEPTPVATEVLAATVEPSATAEPTATTVQEPEPVMVQLEPPAISNPGGIEVAQVSLTRYTDRTEFAMEVKFTVDPKDDAAWTFSALFDDQPNQVNVSGITLFDHETARARYPRRDIDNQCVCTIIDTEAADRDVVQTWSATFDSVAPDAVVTIGMPHLGTVTFLDATTVVRPEPVKLPNGARGSGKVYETLEAISVSTWDNGTVLELHLQSNSPQIERGIYSWLSRPNDRLNDRTPNGVSIITESNPTRPLRPKHDGLACVCSRLPGRSATGEPYLAHLYFGDVPDERVIIAIPEFGTFAFEDGEISAPEVQALSSELPIANEAAIAVTGAAIQQIGVATMIEVEVANIGDELVILGFDDVPHDMDIQPGAFSGLVATTNGGADIARVATVADRRCICSRPAPLETSTSQRWFALLDSTDVLAETATLAIPHFGAIDLADGRVIS